MGLTPEQIEARMQYVGASDVAGIMGLSPFSTPYEVWSSKFTPKEFEAITGQAKPPDKDWKSSRLGDLLEPAVVELACEYLQHEQVEGAAQIQFRHIDDVLVVSPDLFMPANSWTYRKKPQEDPTFVEAKTQGFTGVPLETYGRGGSGQIPKRVMLQVQSQLACTPTVQKAWVALLSGHDAKGHRMFPVKRNQDLIDAILVSVHKFWNTYVLPQVPPAKDLMYV